MNMTGLQWHCIGRTRSCVAHGVKEWARDDNGDGIREVHTNTAEGMWSGLRNFLDPFRSVHQNYLAGYAAIHDDWINLKRISLTFISALVKSSPFRQLSHVFTYTDRFFIQNYSHPPSNEP